MTQATPNATSPFSASSKGTIYQVWLNERQYTALKTVAVQAQKEMASAALQSRDAAVEKCSKGRFAFATLCKADACDRAAQTLSEVRDILFGAKVLRPVPEDEPDESAE